MEFEGPPPPEQKRFQEGKKNSERKVKGEENKGQEQVPGSFIPDFGLPQFRPLQHIVEEILSDATHVEQGLEPAKGSCSRSNRLVCTIRKPLSVRIDPIPSSEK